MLEYTPSGLDSADRDLFLKWVSTLGVHNDALATTLLTLNKLENVQNVSFTGLSVYNTSFCYNSECAKYQLHITLMHSNGMYIPSDAAETTTSNIALIQTLINFIASAIDADKLHNGKIKLSYNEISNMLCYAHDATKHAVVLNTKPLHMITTYSQFYTVLSNFIASVNSLFHMASLAIIQKIETAKAELDLAFTKALQPSLEDRMEMEHCITYSQAKNVRNMKFNFSEYMLISLGNSQNNSMKYAFFSETITLLEKIKSSARFRMYFVCSTSLECIKRFASSPSHSFILNNMDLLCLAEFFSKIKPDDKISDFARDIITCNNNLNKAIIDYSVLT